MQHRAATLCTDVLQCLTLQSRVSLSIAKPKTHTAVKHTKKILNIAVKKQCLKCAVQNKAVTQCLKCAVQNKAVTQSLFSTAMYADHLQTKENHYTESSVSKRYQNCVPPYWALSPVSHSILLCHHHFGNFYTGTSTNYSPLFF